MANIKSAKKRILTSEKRAAANKAVKSGVKTAVKKVRVAVEANDAAAAATASRMPSPSSTRPLPRALCTKTQLPARFPDSQRPSRRLNNPTAALSILKKINPSVSLFTERVFYRVTNMYADGFYIVVYMCADFFRFGEYVCIR